MNKSGLNLLVENLREIRSQSPHCSDEVMQDIFCRESGLNALFQITQWVSCEDELRAIDELYNIAVKPHLHKLLDNSELKSKMQISTHDLFEDLWTMYCYFTALFEMSEDPQKSWLVRALVHGGLLSQLFSMRGYKLIRLSKSNVDSILIESSALSKLNPCGFNIAITFGECVADAFLLKIISSNITPDSECLSAEMERVEKEIAALVGLSFK